MADVYWVCLSNPPAKIHKGTCGQIQGCGYGPQWLGPYYSIKDAIEAAYYNTYVPEHRFRFCEDPTCMLQEHNKLMNQV
ncbi:MAG: hypothetical protein HQK89_16020 [Nitrospirae bacterium]|nr:hypothetical protein [Nitrospirota bacterium]